MLGKTYKDSTCIPGHLEDPREPCLAGCGCLSNLTCNQAREIFTKCMGGRRVNVDKSMGTALTPTNTFSSGCGPSRPALRMGQCEQKSNSTSTDGQPGTAQILPSQARHLLLQETLPGMGPPWWPRRRVLRLTCSHHA